MKFLDKRTNTIKEAFFIEQKEGKIFVQFKENGKVYGYN